MPACFVLYAPPFLSPGLSCELQEPPAETPTNGVKTAQDGAHHPSPESGLSAALNRLAMELVPYPRPWPW